MSGDLVKRLRHLERWDPDQKELANRIEKLKKQLSLINNTLNVPLSEKMTTDWKEFCEALIEETRELLGEATNDRPKL